MFCLFLRGRRAIFKARAIKLVANLLLGATLSFSDSNHFYSLAHTDNIYINFSCFSKKGESSYLCQLYMIRQVSDTSIRG